MDIKNELTSNQTILLLMPSTEYNNVVLETVKQLSEGSVCYVTLNKTYNSLKELFKKNKINIENLVFIDAISNTISKKPSQEKGCYYVSSPGALTELSLAINKFLKHNFDYLIFDSLTSLLVYQKKVPVSKCISSLVNKIKATKTKAVFYALSAKEQEELIRESGMFVDKVVDLENSSNKPISDSKLLEENK